ncbi:MAG: lytB [Haloplasmataceae bacterium]|jgi:stage II sporulation protein D|nr:lytB [Haloplasmataceae bacterium]
MIVKHKIIYEENEAVLCVYLSEDSEEFAKEFGSKDEFEKQTGLMDQIKDYLNNNHINFGGKVVKIIAGSLVVATMLFTGAGGDTDVNASTNAVTYTVESGDNLGVIASKYGITVDDIRTNNNITGDIIHPGQVLNVGTTANTYTVKSGDNLSIISSRLGLSVNQLKSYNNLSNDVIYPGQVLKLSGQTTPGTSTTNISTYTVKSGDSLFAIANRSGLTVNQLITYNNLTSDNIQPGQTLMLQQNSEVGTYTVKSGDSLFLIAQRYNMSVNDLKLLNNIGDTIYPGQTIKVVQAAEDTTSAYTVESGDSLWLIANREGVSVNQLKSMNNLTSDTVLPGQVLTIPAAGAAAPVAPTTTAPAQSNVTVRVRRDNGAVQSISLEQYVVGVIASEIPPHFNEEAFKAQALAARTYAVSKTQDGVILYDDARDQVYKDTAELKQEWGANFDKYYAKSQNAVNATSGQVLKYDGDLIVAYYHSTNNGRTENPVNVWGGDVPYLKSVSSSWDTKSPEFYRTKTMSYSEFRSRLGIPSTSSLSASVISRTDGDAVGTINISGRQFSGSQVKSSLGLRSQDFDLKFDGSKVTITTRGWGHNVGMSQYGAHYMGEDGYSYRQIISHYYNNVTIENI